jgi:hypothetical protein
MKIANRPSLYKRTVDILFDAYFNDTLQHGDCYACAAGNICKEAAIKTGIPNNSWKRLFTTNGTRTRQLNQRELGDWYPYISVYDAVFLVEATGYGVNELGRVEWAFESASQGNSDEDWMFNGLVAVLEVLKEIHEVTEDEESAQRFKAHYESVLAR